jgi:glucosyl-dolichyl phosphate glucuronosyltransferase
MRPDISVLICTYNRAKDLQDLLESVCNQDSGGGAYEIIVVDNNSSDDTRNRIDTVNAWAARPARYLFEPRQGKSYALNTGLQAAGAPLCVVIDDDQIMPPGYLTRLVEAFTEHPDVSFIGGKVLPIWETPPPRWLTPSHWSPLGMADHGDEPFSVDQHRPICLLTFAFRVADVCDVGGFRNELGVTDSRMGSTEDADLISRLLGSGRRGLYLPQLVLHHHAPARRMTQDYYRRWHHGHGGFSALRREASIERSRFRFFDVPAHLYRQALSDLGGFLYHRVSGNREMAFTCRLRLSFFFGFTTQRWKEMRQRI